MVVLPAALAAGRRVGPGKAFQQVVDFGASRGCQGRARPALDVAGDDPPPHQYMLTDREPDAGLLLDAIEAAAASMPRDWQIKWEYAPEYRRADPDWDAAAAALGKTPADVDALFALAVTL